MDNPKIEREWEGSKNVREKEINHPMGKGKKYKIE